MTQSYNCLQVKPNIAVFMQLIHMENNSANHYEYQFKPNYSYPDFRDNSFVIGLKLDHIVRIAIIRYCSLLP